MRAHLLRIVDTDVDSTSNETDDIPAAANDPTCDGSVVAAISTPGPHANRAPALVSVASLIGKSEDDAYWLGGYAGI